MNLIDIKEKSLLKEWASSHANDKITSEVLCRVDKECESYWIKKDENESYISDYSFDNMSELQKEMEHALPDDLFQEMFIPLTIAAFKLRQFENTTHTEEPETKDHPSFEIPDFVYNF